MTSTTFEIGRIPAASSRAFSHTGDGPICDVAEQPGEVARAALEVLDRRPRPPRRACARRIDCPATARARRRRARPPRARARRSRAGRAGCRVDLDLEHLLDERQHVGERRARLERVGEQHDPGVVGAEVDLVLGEDHPLGDLAAQLSALEREPARQRRARQRDRDGRARRRSSRRRRRSGAARASPTSTCRAGAGPRSGASPPRAPCRRGRVEIAARVGDAAADDRARPRTSRPRARSAISPVGASTATYSRSQLSGTFIRTASGSGGRLPRASRMSGEAVAQHRHPLESPAEREARVPPRGRSRRSEHVRVDHAGAADLDPAGVAAHRAAGAVADGSRRRSASIEGSVNGK